MRRMIEKFFPRQYEALRRGQALRFGPVSLVGTRNLVTLSVRLRQAERQIARSGNVAALPLDAAGDDARPAQRSVVFLHHCYYNFYYLAAALRRRGWDAISVSLEGPDSPHAKFYHGEDLNLFDPDPEKFQASIEAFYTTVPDRFRMVHFHGMGHMSFFPALIDNSERFDTVPADFIHLRQLGVRIGYTVTGCLDGVAQSTFHRWSGGCCDTCVWQHNPQVCNDLRNLAWGHKVQMMCDLVDAGTNPALDYQDGPKCVHEPLTTALDPEVWRPDLPIPEKYRLPRESDELIVYHAVGNFSLRARDGRNIKGTPAVIDAVDRLRAEGIKVRLEFVTDVPSKDVRFIQAQAEVIVDQLNYGRYGATAREAMMLGKPTICYINPREPSPEKELTCLKECPLVSANEATVYPVLKDLLTNAEKRRAIGEASRAYALKWYASDACAERFERVYDRLMAGKPPAG